MWEPEDEFADFDEAFDSRSRGCALAMIALIAGCILIALLAA